MKTLSDNNIAGRLSPSRSCQGRQQCFLEEGIKGGGAQGGVVQQLYSCASPSADDTGV